MAHNNSFDFPAFCFHLPDPFFQQAHLRYISNLITSALNAFFAPFAVIANVLVCFAIIVNLSLRSPSCLLIACLAFSDILVSGIVQPSYIAYRLGEIHQGYVRCMTRILYAKGFYICYGVSVTTLSAISLERSLALRLHFRYKGLVTAKRVLMVIIFIWLLNIALASLQLVHNAIARGLHLFSWLAFLIIDRRQIMRQQLPLSSSNHHNFKKQVKLAVDIAYVVRIYFLFNLPVLVVTALHQLVMGHIDTYDYYSWSGTVAFLNSFINPLICLWRRGEIRDAVRKLLGDRLCKKGDPDSPKCTLYLI
ncbi:adenosine receptor A2b-like [Montipora foliosa]|uniref:adenosine receptor A2b-like n=1 Tax=Montipora foliosa TaxID=591990 RepID=UPI0035F1A193